MNEPDTLPDPDITPAVEPDPNVAAANDASAADAGAKLSAAIDDLAKRISAGTASIPTNPVPVAPATPVAPAAVFGPEQIDAIAQEKGVGAAFEAFARNVLMPMYAGQITEQAKRNKREAMRDPEVGPLMKRLTPKVDAYIKQHGINDAYLAEHGYDDIVRAVAASDPDVQNEVIEKRVQAELAKRAPTAAPAAAPAAPRPVEGVSAGAPRAVPARPAASEQQQIEAIPVTAEEEKAAREMFGMSRRDVQKQRFEIAKSVREFGTAGIAGMRGVPIASLDELGLGGGE